MGNVKQSWGVGLAVLALWGCADADEHPDAEAKADSAQTDADGGKGPTAFVGEVEDGDVTVAILADGTHARLFFCGGADTVGEKTHWFNLEKDGPELEAHESTFSLRASFGADAVSGEYGVGDERHAFTGKRVVKGTIAGLYEGTGDCGRLGLIVMQDPSRAQGACVGMGHTPEQVNPILPLASEEGKIRVQAPGSEGETLLLGAAGIMPL